VAEHPAACRQCWDTATATHDDVVEASKWVVQERWWRADVAGEKRRSLLLGVCRRFGVIHHHLHWPSLPAFGHHFATTISRHIPGKVVDQMTTGQQAYKSTAWFSVLKSVLHFFDLYASTVYR